MVFTNEYYMNCNIILYELLKPLYVLFKSSYKLGKPPDEWKMWHVTAVYKKVIKVIHPTTDQLFNQVLYVY